MEEITLVIKRNGESEGVVVSCAALGMTSIDICLKSALIGIYHGFRDIANSYEEIAPAFLSEKGIKNKDVLNSIFDALQND